jgi:hypothetical protein
VLPESRPRSRSVPWDTTLFLSVSRLGPSHSGSSRERSVYQVLGLRGGLIAEVSGYPSRMEAAEHAGLIAPGQGRMHIDALVPILSVSSLL